MSADKFVIRSRHDPTLEYELRDREKFERIYAPKGFYIVGELTPEAYDAKKEARARRKAEREARVAQLRAAKAAAKLAAEQPPAGDDPNPETP